MIVIDASVLTAALTSDTEFGARAFAALAEDPHWVAPDHLRVEVTSAIRGRILGRKIGAERAEEAVIGLGRLKIVSAPWQEVAERVWELRHNVNPYDAAYLALAEIRGCRLVTADKKLAECPGALCIVQVVT